MGTFVEDMVVDRTDADIVLSEVLVNAALSGVRGGINHPWRLYW